MTSHFDEKPWLRKLDEFGQTSVWLVDGTWVRKYLQKEFTNFAYWRHPLFRSVIPNDEFWIDEGSTPEEHQLFVDHMLIENYMMSRGYPFKKAEQEATRVEARERHRGATVTERKLSKFTPELRKLGQTSDIEIFLVDGKMVRDKIDPRFCHGGHDLVYEYVPDKHIWIDNTTVPHEWPYLTIHEVHERNKMNLGEKYLDAHPKCSRIEWKCRQDDQELLRQQKELGLI